MQKQKKATIIRVLILKYHKDFKMNDIGLLVLKYKPNPHSIENITII